MSVSSDMKRARELLGVETNGEVLPAIKALLQPGPQPVVLAVSWTPGTPETEAAISVLSGPAPIPVFSAALRAGLAVLEFQTTQRAMQLQQMLLQEQAKNKESG